jgi:hypothetical protein
VVRAACNGAYNDNKLSRKVTLFDIFGRFLSCNSSNGCPKGVTSLPGSGGGHVGRQDVGLCARDCGVPSRSVVRWSPAWRRTLATTLREKMVSKSRWNRFRDAVGPDPLQPGWGHRVFEGDNVRLLRSDSGDTSGGVVRTCRPRPRAPAPRPRAATTAHVRRWISSGKNTENPGFFTGKTGQKMSKNLRVYRGKRQ